ncbi:MAG TPA: hypothetical protein VNG51_26490 [Ktedonobacteraceae bacterium]|nr:hypothetical protein [Ktedonobacteraceae bacterium]
MNEFTTKGAKQYTRRARLAAVDVKLKQREVFSPIRTTVQIAQKKMKHTAINKLYDAMISVLTELMD